MDFNLTSLVNRKSLRRKRGFTLIEVSLATGIGSMVAIVMAATLMYGVRSLASLNNYIALNRDSRRALDQLTADLRHISLLEDVDQDADGKIIRLTFDDPYSDVDSDKLIYEFDDDNTFNRISQGDTIPLLKNCQGEFEIFKSVNYQCSLVQYVGDVTDPGDCKVVKVRWTCTRRVLNSLVNTEDIVTAKVVLRN